jgi:hypothetical protein
MSRARLAVALAAIALMLTLPAVLHPQSASNASLDFEALPFAPTRYVVGRAGGPLSIDGKLDETSWRNAPWTGPFVDIEGPARPAPRYDTRARMLWDDEYFYVSVQMEEPDLWGTLTARDAIVYNDNDIELFIDPDGDTQNYYELEINPLGTVFDLLLPRTYRDGGPPIIAWDIAGLKVGLDARGTVNRPGDRDAGWTVEVALPWRILREAAPGKRAPRPGEQWRVNFSRVEWQADIKDGVYARRVNPPTGKPVASDNWVWSPQGFVDIHMPERWGYVQFSADPPDGGKSGGASAFVEDPNERVKWALRRLYYRQRRFRAANGRFASDLALLAVNDIRVEGLAFAPTIEATRDLYEITAAGFGSAVVHITNDGRTWTTAAGGRR